MEELYFGSSTVTHIYGGRELIFLSLIAYIIGSIPFGLILTKVFLKQDVREIGSGNVGATNVLRTGKKGLAAATLLLDGMKGLSVLLITFLLKVGYYESCPWENCIPDTCSCWEVEVLIAAGLFAVIGHCFPIWLKFKGGKGVATALGVLVAAVPVAGFVAILVWILSFLAARISSLAAISAMVVAPAVTYAMYGLEPALVNVVISILVIARHHANIKRLMKGEETAFRSGK